MSMRVATAVGTWIACGTAAIAQVDPGYWLPETKLFGTTTVEHVDRNGVHATYPMGVYAPRLARNSVGDVLVGESRDIGVPSFIRVLRAGVGEIAPIGPLGTIGNFYVDSTDHIWIEEPMSFFTRRVRRVSPAGATLFTTAPDVFVSIGANAQNEYMCHAAASSTSTTIRRIKPDGSIVDLIVPFKFTKGILAPSGDIVCQNSGSTVLRVVSPTGTVHATFSLPSLPACPLAMEPTGVLATVTVTAPNVISRYRLDGVQLASVPVVGSEPVNRVDPATDRTYWLLRLHPVDAVTVVQHIDSLGRILESFTPAVVDSFTSISAVGDLTGAIRVSVNAPNEDSDLDGFINASELELGSDPLDPASVPPTIDVNVIATSPTVLDFDIADAARPNQP
ncbi:MAG: hypothetical protein IT459_08185, partial [Planctomycetes bacterium]|nr:hypothetical protein [Planctomycetota bacterium]